jgi:hypothetical protein
VLFSGRSKHLPYFSDYLNYVVKQGPPDNILSAIGFAFGGFIAFAGVALGFAFKNLTPIASILTCGIAGACFAVAVTKYRNYKALTAQGEARVLAEAREVSLKFHKAQKQYRLHRDLHPNVLDLLESAARNWKRIRDAVDSEILGSPDLPDHWKTIRDRASRNADLGMAEIMVLLQDELQEPRPPADVQESITYALQSIGITIGTTKPGFDHIPVEFEPARKIAERLGVLASELEKTSQDILTSGEHKMRLTSSQSIDETLEELRHIRIAEQEISEQQIRLQ